MADLLKKMRITPGTTITVLSAPSDYKKTLGQLPEGVTIKTSLKGKVSFVQLFVKNKKELEKEFEKTYAALEENGLIWIAYPKGTSGIQTDLTRDKGWDVLEKVKGQWLALISFDENWSAFLMRKAPPKAASKASETYHAQTAAYSDAKTKTVIIPDDLGKAFAKNKKAKTFFDTLPFTGRKEYVIWIVSAKREETRTERVQKSIVKLLAGKKLPTEK